MESVFRSPSKQNCSTLTPRLYAAKNEERIKRAISHRISHDVEKKLMRSVMDLNKSIAKFLAEDR